MNKKTRTRSAMLLALLTITLTGCSGDNETASLDPANNKDGVIDVLCDSSKGSAARYDYENNDECWKWLQGNEKLTSAQSILEDAGLPATNDSSLKKLACTTPQKRIYFQAETKEKYLERVSSYGYFYRTLYHWDGMPAIEQYNGDEMPLVGGFVSWMASVFRGSHYWGLEVILNEADVPTINKHAKEEGIKTVFSTYPRQGNIYWGEGSQGIGYSTVTIGDVTNPANTDLSSSKIVTALPDENVTEISCG